MHSVKSPRLLHSRLFHSNIHFCSQVLLQCSPRDLSTIVTGELDWADKQFSILPAAYAIKHLSKPLICCYSTHNHHFFLVGERKSPLDSLCQHCKCCFLQRVACICQLSIAGSKLDCCSQQA